VHYRTRNVFLQRFSGQDVTSTGAILPALIINDNKRSFPYHVNIGSGVHKSVFFRFISFILNRERRAGDFMP